MLIVRGTKKLRDRIRHATVAGPDDESTTVLGDWFATIMFWRPQVVLLVNTRTYLPVFMPYAPGGDLTERVGGAIAAILTRHGASAGFVAAERASMDQVRIAPTNSRRVLGVMNEFAFLAERHRERGPVDLSDLSLRLARTPTGPLYESSISPDRELAAVLADAAADHGHPEAPAAHGTPSGGTVADDVASVIPLRPGDGPIHSDPANPTPPQQSPAGQAPIRQGPSRGSKPGEIYRLKVTLKNTKPPIWRRVLVDGSATLAHLHEVIQAAFGWWNYHLHEFDIDGHRFGVPDPENELFGMPTIDETRARLKDVATKGSRFDYTYDFGDGWEHRIDVESVEPSDPSAEVPSCIGGRRACPPEDCGGPWGYEELLAILADPNHPEHEMRVEWMGRPFDPAHFDPDDFAINLQLQEATDLDQ